jgi:hypothetical protein
MRPLYANRAASEQSGDRLVGNASAKELEIPDFQWEGKINDPGVRFHPAESRQFFVGVCPLAAGQNRFGKSAALF